MIFQKLSSYQWTTQVLLVLAAFSLHYGEFWYICRAPSDGGNALSTCLLKGLISLKKKLWSEKNMKTAITTLNNVVHDLLELATSLVDLYKLHEQHRVKHVPGLESFGEIPTWSCDTIIAILVTGNYFARLVNADDKFAESELKNLVSSVSHLKSTVLQKAEGCKRGIAQMEEYQKYAKKVEAPVDIVDFLKSLLAAKASSRDPIVTGPNNTPVKLESFRKKKGLLIISGLEISADDAATLKRIHDHLKHSQTEKETHYEFVWIPIRDAKPPNNSEALFKSLMPWALKVDPRKMNVLAPKYIETEWGFQRETMVVVLDSLGSVENLNFMHMVRIWGTSAFQGTWKDPFNWVQLVITLTVPREKLVVIKTAYTLFYGGTAALKSDIAPEIPHLSMVHINDTKGFFIRLRSCLISRLEAVKTNPVKINPLIDPIVCEMCEAYKACHIGGFAILTKGPDLQKQHISLFDAASTLANDLKRVKELVDKDKGIDLAEAFKKKEPGVQELSGRKHFYVPHYHGLGDLCCPDDSWKVSYDLSFTCCHSGSDQGGARQAKSSTDANAK
ncbi:hypothetical protein ACJRO7_032540 [Eucalyptus globulus]|uniref:Sieve element occlusion N-terminal domain-containing protein n=1 Tax=Eucalyptus globulus TaxID=34317 RepID=A0ABD3JME1_EUCGL